MDRVCLRVYSCVGNIISLMLIEDDSINGR